MTARILSNSFVQQILKSNSFKIAFNKACKLAHQLPKIAPWGLPAVLGGKSITVVYAGQFYGLVNNF
jgi:hypothetical protein